MDIFGRFLSRIRAAPGGKPPVGKSQVGRTLSVDDVVTEGVDILPAASAEWCRREMAALAGSPPPGEAGWDEARLLRPDAGAESIADLAIPLSAAQAALSERLTPFDAVLTGDPNNPRQAPAGHGFGPTPLSAAVIYAPIDAPAGAATLSAIEVTLRGTPEENAAVLSALGALPARLIAADWQRLRLAALDDPAEIARFVA